MSAIEVLRRPQILVVDDEVAMVRSLELLLRPVGDVHKAYSVPEAEENLAKESKIDCVITDVCMPEDTGLSLLEKMKKKYPETPVILMTAFSSVPQAVEAIQKGAFEYVMKPFENDELVGTVKRAIARKGLSGGETKKMPKGWICNSQSMKDFLEKAEKIVGLDSPLLIYGESGVGKGRAAHWIHDLGPRVKRDFLAIDGRAHEEDSPLRDKNTSKLGTLFIAEVFSLNPRLQDRVWDLMKNAKLRILGSTSVSPDIQAPKGFRPDLFEALSAVRIKFPSLRERPQDLEALTQEILAVLSAKLKIKSLQLHTDALKKLCAYSFPGNVRELERILEQAALESKAGLITDADLRFEKSDLKGHLPFAVPLEDGWSRLELFKESLERELIGRALEKYPEYSNTEIAVILGTTRRILELRMKQYKIREGV